MTRILLVEDDPGIVRPLRDFLEREGYETVATDTEKNAVRLLRDESFDLALIDLSLPQGDGTGVAAAARAVDLPFIFLTASDDEAHVVAGFAQRAEDYVAKPFRPRELLARMQAVLRRTGKAASVLEVGPLRVDLDRGTVRKNGEDVYLSPLEYRLLLILLQHRGSVRSRQQLMEELWDFGAEYMNDNTLNVYIRRLRSKIEDDAQAPRIVHTVRGQGYCIP